MVLLTSCVTWTPRSQRTSSSAVVIPNMPMQKWGIESCGAGSLSTVLQHYGDRMSMSAWDAALPKTRGGVLTVDMLIAARQKGFDASIATGDRSSVMNELREGRPLILMLKVVDSPGHTYDFFHYVVVDGVDPAHDLIRVQFGDGRGRWLTLDRLEKPWAGGSHAAILIRRRDELAEQLRDAVALEEEGRVAEAAVRYRDLLGHHSDSVVTWTNLGNAEMRLGRTTDAEKAFRKALVIDPNVRDALNNLAWLLLEQKRLDEAETLARRAAAQPGPDSYLVLDTLARILAAKGSCSEAAATFREAIAVVPSDRSAARSDLERGLAETQRSCS